MTPVVVAGASGFVGQHLVDRLTRAGRVVRCGTRDAAAARTRDPARSWVTLDVDRPETLPEALQGADALVYLVHQMRGAHGPDLVARERASAEAVRLACVAAGVRRIVYLGGPAPAGAPSEHLAARLVTGEALRAGGVSCIELRAAMIIGVGSESWTMTRDLALRLPVMLLPKWLATRSQPVGIDDVVDALVAAIDDPLTGSGAFDLPGPEVLTAREVLERIAAQRGIRPVMVPVPVLTPSLSAHWLRFVTRADYGVARQLVDGLGSDLVSVGPGYWARMPGRAPTPFTEVVRRAFAAEAGTVPRRDLRWEAWVQRWARRASTPSGS